MSYVNSAQFSIIGLLIRPFPEKYKTSILSVGQSVGYSDPTEKMMKKPVLHHYPLCMK